jgi:uncharacterized hydrophobic protein (TIGR00341 family)
MRLIQFLAQEGNLDDVVSVLDDLGVDPVVLSTDHRNASLVSFPVPTGAVEDILDEFRDAGLDPDNYIVVTEVESATTPHFENLEKQYTEGPEAETHVSHEELRTSAREIEPERTVFVAQAVLSAAVAAAGLLLNSAVVTVGAMVIAPFTGSLLSVALSAIIGDRDLLVDSTTSQALGLAIAMLTGAGVGLLTKWSAVPPNHTIIGMKQISEFSSPNFLLVIIAIAAGSASAFALATNQGTALAGVAVAAAIVPSAAAVGIGLAWGLPSIAAGAFVLLIINVLFINVTSYITFILIGYQPPILERIR